MLDTLATLRAFIVAQAPLMTLTTQVYAGVTYPPPAYGAGQRALCFNGRGGGVDYGGRLLTESYTFKVYGADEPDAMLVYRTLVDVLHDKRGGAIRQIELEVAGYPLREPATNWPFVLTFFRVIFSSGIGE